jgi:cell division septation protein DedD
MIYPLLVLFNSILFFLVPFFAPNGEPKISTNFPSTLVIDQEAVLEIKISKAQLSGFATFQMDLPDGFVPREIENAEAVCAITQGQLVWTWSELPEEEELIISVGITPHAAAHGKKVIGASFYYIDNNDKKSVDIQAVEMAVLNEGETGLNTDTPANPAQTTANWVDSSHSEPSGIVNIQRTVLDGTVQNEKKIELTIKKGITKGFARYSDNLEPGFSAKAVKTDGSSFSIADGKIKFVWVSVPEKEALKVSYILICQSNVEEILLRGEYSYLEHNQSKKSLSAEQNIRFEKLQPPGQKPAEEIKSATVKTETPATTEGSEPTENPVQVRLEKQVNKQQRATTFAIQIGAFTSTKVSVQTLKRKFKLKENLRSEFQEGYSKFMFGYFGAYKAARDQREQTIRANGIKSAFVVAYNNGKRITVQEALMTLNQKWFK